MLKISPNRRSLLCQQNSTIWEPFSKSKLGHEILKNSVSFLVMPETGFDTMLLYISSSFFINVTKHNFFSIIFLYNWQYFNYDLKLYLKPAIA